MGKTVFCIGFVVLATGGASVTGEGRPWTEPSLQAAVQRAIGEKYEAVETREAADRILSRHVRGLEEAFSGDRRRLLQCLAYAVARGDYSGWDDPEYIQVLVLYNKLFGREAAMAESQHVGAADEMLGTRQPLDMKAALWILWDGLGQKGGDFKKIVRYLTKQQSRQEAPSSELMDYMLQIDPVGGATAISRVLPLVF